MDMQIKRNKTLNRKILKTSVYTLLILAVAIGAVSVYFVGIVSDSDSAKIMIGLCETEAQKIDNKLSLVKNSVEIIHEYSKEHQKYVPDIFSQEFEDNMKEFTITVANQTAGAMAVYFRYNPEITGSGTDGFFWSRSSDDEMFKEEPPTDILAYNYTDIEHVGWFYTPKETGRTLWMNPYFNQNLDVFMISYIVPVYMENGDFIGVIGMDIDFKTIIDEACGNRIYQSGSVIIADLKERLIYSADSDGTVKTEKLLNRLYNHITTVNREDDLLEIVDDSGSVSVICCQRLSNGMMMYVNVPKREIDQNRNLLTLICVLITAVAWAITVLITERKMKKIVDPLEKLTAVADRYSEGKWDTVYISDTEDEIQMLSERIAKMADNTQTYINKINDLARRDSLTGIRNKTAYFEEIRMIKENRHGAYDHYAVVVMDLNLLKKTNDLYGHEIGDLLLKEAASYICSVFSHSAVFRIGGDEFAALLYTEDYDNREILLARFEKGMNYLVPDTENAKLSISFGMASCPEEQQDFEQLFTLADERMYQKKKEMKMERND